MLEKGQRIYALACYAFIGITRERRKVYRTINASARIHGEKLAETFALLMRSLEGSMDRIIYQSDSDGGEDARYTLEGTKLNATVQTGEIP